jgi:hypothetical protein
MLRHDEQVAAHPGVLEQLRLIHILRFGHHLRARAARGRRLHLVLGLLVGQSVKPESGY